MRSAFGRCGPRRLQRSRGRSSAVRAVRPFELVGMHDGAVWTALESIMMRAFVLPRGTTVCDSLHEPCIKTLGPVTAAIAGNINININIEQLHRCSARAFAIAGITYIHEEP